MNDAACTLASEQRDFPEWHRGRPWFAVWAIALDQADVHSRLGQVHQALAGMLLTGNQRQPHITLQICGFPVPTPSRHDDFGLAQLQAQVAALRRAGQRPFELGIGAPFSFASAACLAVQDGSGALARLRQALQAAAPSSDATPYVPHVTAGLYNGAWPMPDVQRRLQALPAQPGLGLAIRSLDWMGYHSAQVLGPLSTLLRLDLARGDVHVPDEGRLQAVFSDPAKPPPKPRPAAARRG